MNKVIENDINNVTAMELPWDSFKGKTVLVTGATGFIGSFIIHTLLTRSLKYGDNTRILALVRSKDRASKLFSEYENAQLIDYIVQDVCIPLPIDKKADYVIHCASNAAPKEYGSDPVGTMKTNFYGTLNLLDYAKAVGAKKFLYVSTIEVYGTTQLDTIKEDDYGYIDAGNVRSCYPLSKKICETLCLSYAAQYGVEVCIGRLSYIFGPGMKQGDSKIVAMFPRSIANGEDIVMKSKGEQLRSYTYVSDAIAALLLILAKGENNQAYNIASPDCITTIAGIAHKLVSMYPEKKLKVVFDLPSDAEARAFSLIRNAVLDSNKLQQLGWTPVVDLETGLANVVREQESFLKE